MLGSQVTTILQDDQARSRFKARRDGFAYADRRLRERTPIGNQRETDKAQPAMALPLDLCIPPYEVASGDSARDRDSINS